MSGGRVPFLDPRKTSCFVKTFLRSGNQLSQMKTTMNNSLMCTVYLASLKSQEEVGELEEKPSAEYPQLSRVPPHPSSTNAWRHRDNWGSGTAFGTTWQSNPAKPQWLTQGLCYSDCSSFIQMELSFTKNKNQKSCCVGLQMNPRIGSTHEACVLLSLYNQYSWWWSRRWRQGNSIQDPWMTVSGIWSCITRAQGFHHSGNTRR